MLTVNHSDDTWWRCEILWLWYDDHGWDWNSKTKTSRRDIVDISLTLSSISPIRKMIRISGPGRGCGNQQTNGDGQSEMALNEEKLGWTTELSGIWTFGITVAILRPYFHSGADKMMGYVALKQRDMRQKRWELATDQSDFHTSWGASICWPTWNILSDSPGINMVSYTKIISWYHLVMTNMAMV